MGRRLIDSAIDKITINYPITGGWSLFTDDEDLKLQIYQGAGRQPLHLDASLGWYPDGFGNKWAPLSCVISLNDGPGTFLGGAPVFGQFDLIHKHTVEQSKKAFTNLLDDYEKKFDENLIKISRAGQMLCFHPGEQIHCGVSTDYKCTLSGDIFPDRVVLFLFLVPSRFIKITKKLNLFSSEYPWGLQQNRLPLSQVFLSLFIKLRYF